jgi:transposase
LLGSSSLELQKNNISQKLQADRGPSSVPLYSFRLMVPCYYTQKELVCEKTNKETNFFCMQIELTEKELSELKTVQRNVSGSDYIKVTCILMLHKNVSPEDISEYLGIDTSTVYRYRNQYISGGVSGYLGNKYKGYWGLLSSCQLSLLRKEMKEHIYTNSKSISVWIKSTFGVKYTPQGVVDLLKRIGFTYKKTKEVPCERDAEKQEVFVEKLSGILSDMDESSVVYYADGVHPTHNSRSTYAWIEKGEDLEQPTVSGRDRININGLLNAKDVTDVIAHECASVNAESTMKMYQAALEKHPHAKCIYIISDNARYYKNKYLNEWLKETKIKQIFLPPYSPNLNLIERLWRFLRKKVINTNFYRTKDLFREAVRSFFKHISNYKQELETLLTLNFRLCNSQSISF